MQMKARKSAVSMLLAVMMVFPLFDGIMPAAAAAEYEQVDPTPGSITLAMWDYLNSTDIPSDPGTWEIAKPLPAVLGMYKDISYLDNFHSVAMRSPGYIQPVNAKGLGNHGPGTAIDISSGTRNILSYMYDHLRLQDWSDNQFDADYVNPGDNQDNGTDSGSRSYKPSDKYWSLEFSTKNFENLHLSFLMYSSPGGSKYFKVQYSSDGLALDNSAKKWTDLPDGDIVHAAGNARGSSWSFLLPNDLDDMELVHVRLLKVGNTRASISGSRWEMAEADGGTSYINTIRVRGTEIEQTEATAAEWNYTEASQLPASPTLVPTNGVFLDSAILSNHLNATPAFENNGLCISNWSDSTMYPDKFWLIWLPTTNFSNLTFSFDAWADADGPMNFILQHSLDNINWVEFPNGEVTLDTSLASYKFVLPAGLLGQNLLYIRLLTSDDANGKCYINNIKLVGMEVIPTDPVDALRKPPIQTKVTPVLANPRSGVVTEDVNIGLSCATQDLAANPIARATIYYIINGGEQQTYSGTPISLTEVDFPVQIEAWATMPGAYNMEPSDRMIYTYSLKRPIEPNTEFEHYRGLIHGHTRNSDGTGTLEQAYAAASNPDGAGLDFFAITDHAEFFENSARESIYGGIYGNLNWGGGARYYNWEEGFTISDKFNESGKFAALYGYEMTWSIGIPNGLYGHMNTLNTNGYVTSNNPRYSETADHQGLLNYYDDLTNYPNAITMYNHTDAYWGNFQNYAYWTPEHDKVMSLIEMGNGWTRYEYQFDLALSKGWHLAPVYSDDNHAATWGTATPGRTVALATELSRESIYEALKDRRCYSSTDRYMDVDYTINGMPMGTIFDQEVSELKFHIKATHPSENIGMVSIITGDGAGGAIVVDTKYFDSPEARWDFTLPAKYSYYYVKIVQPDNDLIVTAPIWIPIFEEDITVNFPGLKDVSVQYYTNNSQWVTVGKFDDTCNFTIPEGHKATWGATTVRIVKNGMYHTFTLDAADKALVLDAPISKIAISGIASACNLAIVQNDWVYHYAPATVGGENEFLVFGNGKAYEIRLQKPGASIISIKGIEAGQTVDISEHFYGDIAVYDAAHAAFCSYYDTATWTFIKELFLDNIYRSILEAEQIMNKAGQEHADLLTKHGKLAAGRFDASDSVEAIAEGTRILNQGIADMMSVLR